MLVGRAWKPDQCLGVGSGGERQMTGGTIRQMTGERSARTREERLAKALKANLSRRKDQARARGSAKDREVPSDPADETELCVDAEKPQGPGG